MAIWQDSGVLQETTASSPARAPAQGVDERADLDQLQRKRACIAGLDLEFGM